MDDVTQSLYAIPGKLLHELLTLCGPEDHELRERIRAALAAAPQAPAAPSGLPWRNVADGIPAWTDDATTRVIAVTANDDFGGVQVHDIRASDFYTDGDGAEVARACTHWAYRDDIWPRADAAAPAAPAVDAALPRWWPDFIQCVAELPDRNSPEDEPDAMIATAEELGACALAAQAKEGGAQ